MGISKSVVSLLLTTLLAGTSVLACSSEADPASEGEGDGAWEGDEQDFTSGFKPGCEKKTVAPYALGGTILTPKGPMAGFVVVRDEKIEKVVKTKTEIPADVKKVVDTKGIISPGLIDLHNHVAYNFLPLWNSGMRFNNRYQWARKAEYDTAVKNPYNAVKNAKHQCEGVKYGEYRALVGGTTTIQGSVDLGCTRSWVRNVEFTNFCEDHVRQHVLPINGIKPEAAKTLNDQFKSGATKTFFVHLAEGIDDLSRREFEELRGLDLLKPQVVGIHSTALTEAQIKEMGKVGMKIVWSPLSNLILYGQTTNIPAALDAGVKVALAPDWSPSGPSNSLGELKIADRVNRERFGGKISDEQLFEMVTSNAADIAGLDDKIGRIEEGKFADLMVFRGDARKPFRALIDAKPGDVLLSVISGEAYYGDKALLDGMGAARKFETVDACGEKRQLSVGEEDTRIPGGTQTLKQITDVLAKDGVKDIIPLFECSQDQFEFAFKADPKPPVQK
jgi:cytosine/adenosine deaminase-related metal-dependent hydrolase